MRLVGYIHGVQYNRTASIYALVGMVYSIDKDFMIGWKDIDVIGFGRILTTVEPHLS